MKLGLLSGIKKFGVRNWGLILITVIYLLTILYMLPLKNQIYGDDFAYISTVKDFLDTGIVKVSEWSTASFLFQLFWGALFNKVFGYSIKTLQFSTVTIFYIALIFFYLLLKRTIKNEAHSVIFTLVLMSFPPLFFMSYTFLTYVPSASLSIIASYFIVKAIQQNKLRDYIIGGVISSLGFLNRQDLIAIPLSLLLVLILRSIAEKKINIKQFLGYFIFVTPTVASYLIWIMQPGNMTTGQYSHVFHLLYFLPIPLGRLYTTHLYYTKYIKGAIFYFFQLIPFLLPIFLIFKIKLTSIIREIKTFRKPILITITIFLLMFSIEYVFRYSNPIYAIDAPNSFLMSDKFFPIDLIKNWKNLVFISIFIWLPLMGISFSKFLSKLLPRKGTNNPKMLVFLFPSAVFVLTVMFYYIKAFLFIFKGKGNYFKIIVSPDGANFLYHSWTVLAILSLLVILILYLFICRRIQLKFVRANLDKLFLVFAFVFLLAFQIFFMKSHWPHYVTTLAPSVFLWLASVSKDWRINPLSTLGIITLLIVFSLAVTKPRYIDAGFRYELGFKLVDRGIKPIKIGGIDNYGWLAWWYYKSTLQEEIAKSKGNKYDIAEIGSWHNLDAVYPEQMEFFVVPVPLYFDYRTEPKWKIVFDTGPSYAGIGSQLRYVVYQLNN